MAPCVHPKIGGTENVRPRREVAIAYSRLLGEYIGREVSPARLKTMHVAIPAGRLIGRTQGCFVNAGLPDDTIIPTLLRACKKIYE